MQWFSHDLITSKLNQRINIDLSVRTIHTTETFLENIFNNDEKRVIFSGKDSFDPRKLCACSKIKNTSKNFFFFERVSFTYHLETWIRTQNYRLQNPDKNRFELKLLLHSSDTRSCSVEVSNSENRDRKCYVNYEEF